MSEQDIFVTFDDVRTIIVSGFVAFGEVLKPDDLAKVVSFLRKMGDGPTITPAAAAGIKQLADLLEGTEPPEPAPDRRPQFKLITGGGSAGGGGSAA